MKNKYFKFVLPFVTLVALISVLSIFNPKVFADGNGSDNSCKSTNVTEDPNDSGNGSGLTFNFDAGDGNEVTGVCIKSGNNMFGGNKHSGLIGNGDYESGCYSIYGVGSRYLKVVRNNSGRYCQGISHLDIEYKKSYTHNPSPSPSPSPSSTPWPSPSPTPTPSPEPSPDPECIEDCYHDDPSPSPSSSPSPDPSPEPSPIPPTGGDDGGSNSDDNSTIGEILGVSSLADTGNTGLLLEIGGILAIILGLYGLFLAKRKQISI